MKVLTIYKANFVFANFTKKLGFGQTPPPPLLGQNPKFGKGYIFAWHTKYFLYQGWGGGLSVVGDKVLGPGFEDTADQVRDHFETKS